MSLNGAWRVDPGRRMRLAATKTNSRAAKAGPGTSSRPQSQPRVPGDPTGGAFGTGARFTQPVDDSTFEGPTPRSSPSPSPRARSGPPRKASHHPCPSPCGQLGTPRHSHDGSAIPMTLRMARERQPAHQKGGAKRGVADAALVAGVLADAGLAEDMLRLLGDSLGGAGEGAEASPSSQYSGSGY